MFQWLQQHRSSSDLLQHVFLSFLSIFFIALLFKYFILDRYKSSTRKLNLPPSPWKLPIIGNLHQIGSLPHHSLCHLSRQHGPLMLLRFGQEPILIVSSADAAKEVLQTQDPVFASRPKHNSIDRLAYSSRGLAFSPYGSYWRQVRKISAMQLFSTARVESYRSIREEEAELTINKIRQLCCSGSSLVNVSELVSSFVIYVVGRIALGMKYEGNAGDVKFEEIITEFLYLMGSFHIGDFIPWLAWVDCLNGTNARIEKNKKDLDCILESVIQEHVRLMGTVDSGGAGVKDFVDVLLDIEKDGSLDVAFNKECIKAILLDMFAAGTSTTSGTAIWAMAELMRHPDIMKEAQAEVRGIVKAKSCVTEDDLGQMRYLKMVIKETLRLHTPGPLLLPRASIQDTKLQRYDIPTETTVLINAYAIGRDPTWWEEPEEFRPQRFSNTSVDYRGYEFGAIPFGAGRRVCPGVLFSSPNMELMLASLLCHFNWNLPREEEMDMDETPGLDANKKSPLILVATPWVQG